MATNVDATDATELPRRQAHGLLWGLDPQHVSRALANMLHVLGEDWNVVATNTFTTGGTSPFSTEDRENPAVITAGTGRGWEWIARRAAPLDTVEAEHDECPCLTGDQTLLEVAEPR